MRWNCDEVEANVLIQTRFHHTRMRKMAFKWVKHFLGTTSMEKYISGTSYIPYPAFKFWNVGKYAYRVRTALPDQNSRTFQGQFFNFQGLKIYTKVGSDSHVRLNTHLPLHRNCTRQPPHIISRFENEAANIHKGGDLRQNLSYKVSICTYFMFYTHCPINKYEIYISRLI